MTEFTTKIESKFLDKKEMKNVAAKIKTVYKSAVETASVWKCLSEEGEVLSTGFVLFRKIGPKDAGKFPPGRKLVTVLKYKKRIGDENQYWVGEEELDQAEAQKFEHLMQDLERSSPQTLRVLEFTPKIE